jgi:hypothetical protein
MKNTTSFFITLLISFLLSGVVSQTIAQTSSVTIELQCDSSSKSVLLSSLFENRAGDQSPIIGTAAWNDKGKQLQCRSLLEFDFNILALYLKPDQITRAHLILTSAPVDVSAKAEDQEDKFIVRRVLTQWEDSTANWLNQPLGDPKDEVSKRVPAKKKDRTVKIDVTKMVKNMFQFGNNGFMLCYPDLTEAPLTASHWFASARNENEKMRPILQISFDVAYTFRNSPGSDIPRLPLTAQDKMNFLQNYLMPLEPPTPKDVNTAPVIKQN